MHDLLMSSIFLTSWQIQW